MPKLDDAVVQRITKRGVAEVIVEREFVRLLEDGRPLRLKMGFDPSRPDLHLGHVVGLRKLRQLQDMGHQVILIVGDWTAQIGDPSGESDTRTMLSAAEVMANAETYMSQFFKIVDPARTQAVYQSEWYGKFTLASVIELTAKFTVNQFLHRDDFARRYAAGQPVAVTELLYPLLQAYDSVAINADVEFGGTDQKFNLLVGRELQEKMGQRPQQCFLMPLLVGTDGVRKMSKSLDNYIAVDDPPGEMFGKVMSLPDALLPDYFELFTELSDAGLSEARRAVELGGRDAMDLKKRLGLELVSQFHSPEAARAAEAGFRRVVQQGQAPDHVPEFVATAQTDGVRGVAEAGLVVDLPRFLVAMGMVASNSEARRFIREGVVEVEGRPVGPFPADLPGWARESGMAGAGSTTYLWPVPSGAVVRIGRRQFVRVVRG